MAAMVPRMVSRRLQLAERELEPVMKAFVILSAAEDTDSVGCWVPPLSCQLCCSKIKRAPEPATFGTQASIVLERPSQIVR